MAGGWPDAGSPMHFMRFGWIAEAVNSSPEQGLHYELYRPRRKYDAVVFLKSMEHGCVELAGQLRGDGRCAIFEANVDYYAESASSGLPAELAPEAGQREKAIRMTSGATAVLASSRRLAEVCRPWNADVTWIPDNVPLHLIPKSGDVASRRTDVLELWWSGMAAKVFDLLLIGNLLARWGKRIRLNIVTGDLGSALQRAPAAKAEQMRRFLGAVPHRLHRFRSIGDLLDLYSRGPGAIISPRYLDNAYNASHSEWKITLGMACGLAAIASPQPSYLDVAARCTNPTAATICESEQNWEAALENALAAGNAGTVAEAARGVVKSHYSTEVVARMHADAVRKAIAKSR